MCLSGEGEECDNFSQMTEGLSSRRALSLIPHIQLVTKTDENCNPYLLKLLSIYVFT